MNDRIKWNLLLFVAIALFLASLMTGQVWFSIIAIGIAFIIRKYGDKTLFADYYERKRIVNERFEQHKAKFKTER